MKKMKTRAIALAITLTAMFFIPMTALPEEAQQHPAGSKLPPQSSQSTAESPSQSEALPEKAESFTEERFRIYDLTTKEIYEIGADDYITKPFNPVVMIARVKAQLRRYMMLGGNVPKEPEADTLTIGGVCLDDRAKKVTIDGDMVNLTKTEYAILKFLMEHPNTVYAPKDIYRAVWEDAPFGQEGTVAVHIRHLREKIEADPSEPRYIKVVWGQGYMFGKE